MGCKDCYHYDACMHLTDADVETLVMCEQYKDKSKIIELPTDWGRDVYCIAAPCEGCECFNEVPDIENLNVCRECQKREIIVCKFDYEIICEFGKTVFLTKEEAEKRLEEMRNA